MDVKEWNASMREFCQDQLDKEERKMADWRMEMEGKFREALKPLEEILRRYN